MEPEESTFLTSDYTTKLQSSRQYGTGTKTEMQTNGTFHRTRTKYCTIRMETHNDTKQQKQYRQRTELEASTFLISNYTTKLQ